MDARLVSEDNDFITIKIPKKFEGSMLESENFIQSLLNEAGVLATAVALKRFDTKGEPIVVNGVKLTSMGLINKPYQTPYGLAAVQRHLYQTSSGGKTFCPLEKEARIIITSTPKFAKMIASKFSVQNARGVVTDLSSNHGRFVSLCLVQNIADMVGSFAQAADEAWEYAVPDQSIPVKTISLGLDGTCMLMVEGEWRQAMVGTIALYDRAGERLHTTYIGTAPELGRETFLRRLEKAFLGVRSQYPRALAIGLADGAPSNWDILEKHTDLQILDFYHASEYLTKVADAVFSNRPDDREEWMEKVCHRLKHESTGPASVKKEMAHLAKVTPLKPAEKDLIKGAIQYFHNNRYRMSYALQVSCNRPIGSGVTEAACKVIIKQRLCCSGMRWKHHGAGAVISLRCLNQTEGRWDQFWSKSQEIGYPDGWDGTYQ